MIALRIECKCGFVQVFQSKVNYHDVLSQIRWFDWTRLGIDWVCRECSAAGRSSPTSTGAEMRESGASCQTPSEQANPDNQPPESEASCNS